MTAAHAGDVPLADDLEVVAFPPGGDLTRRACAVRRDGLPGLKEARDVAAEICADDRLGERRAGLARRVVRVLAAEAEAAPELRAQGRIVHRLVREGRDESFAR
jgi:hypothetical protein